MPITAKMSPPTSIGTRLLLERGSAAAIASSASVLGFLFIASSLEGSLVALDQLRQCTAVCFLIANQNVIDELTGLAGWLGRT